MATTRVTLLLLLLMTSFIWYYEWVGRVFNPVSVDYICPFDLLTIPCLAYRTDQVDLNRPCYSSVGLTRKRYSGFYPMTQLRLVVLGEIADFRLDRKKHRGLKYQEIFRQFYSP